MGNISCKDTSVSSSIITLRKEIRSGSLKEVSEGLKAKGVESVNLIVGVSFTRRKGWTAGETNLHFITEGSPNRYETVISLVGKTIKALKEDNTIQCFGFGDATTQAKHIFMFYEQEMACPGFEEAAMRYSHIARNARLTEQVSYDPIIRKAVCIAKAMPQQHHLLVIIGSEPVARNRDTQAGKLSKDEQNTIDAIKSARNHRLSIVLVGVGETNGDMMAGWKNKIKGADNFKFVDYTQIMSTPEPIERRENAFRLAVFENLLTENTGRLQVSSNPGDPAPPEVPAYLPPVPP